MIFRVKYERIMIVGRQREGARKRDKTKRRSEAVMVRRWEDMRDEGREAMITIYCMKKKNLCSILKSTLSEKQN